VKEKGWQESNLVLDDLQTNTTSFALQHLGINPSTKSQPWRLD